MLFAFFFTISCKKETPPEIDVELGICDLEVNYSSEPSLPVIYQEKLEYKFPYFNPNNANEIIYYFTDNDEGKNQLVKVDLVSKVSTIIANDVYPSRQIKWSKNGWIAFEERFNIWKLQDNGSNLTSITTERTNTAPLWTESGDFLIWSYREVSSGNRAILSYEMNTNSIDTLLYDLQFFNGDLVSEDNKVYTQLNKNGVNQLGYFDLTKENLTNEDFQSITSLANLNFEHPQGLHFISCGRGINSDKVYISQMSDGLYEFDTKTLKARKIKDFCARMRYNSISCSPDGRHLVVGRIISFNEGTTVTQRYDIALIDLNTLEETKLRF